MESIGNTTIQNLTAPNSPSNAIDSKVHIFRGTPQKTTGYNYICTIVNATHTGTLKIYHSIDGIVWDIFDTYQYTEADIDEGGLYNITTAKALYCMVEFENTQDAYVPPLVPPEPPEPIPYNSIRLQTFLRTVN